MERVTRQKVNTTQPFSCRSSCTPGSRKNGLFTTPWSTSPQHCRACAIQIGVRRGSSNLYFYFTPLCIHDHCACTVNHSDWRLQSSVGQGIRFRTNISPHICYSIINMLYIVTSDSQGCTGKTIPYGKTQKIGAYSNRYAHEQDRVYLSVHSTQHKLAKVRAIQILAWKDPNRALATEQEGN